MIWTHSDAPIKAVSACMTDKEYENRNQSIGLFLTNFQYESPGG